MDYREACRCGSRMEACEVDPDEARHMANAWRKHHTCLAPRIDRETGEITDGMLDQPIWQEMK